SMTRDGHVHRDLSGKSVGCEDYMQALEEERRKILVFQRELPLCLELVTHAIDSCKQQQLTGTTTTTTGECNLNECNSDQTTSGGVAAFEEFIPIKRPSSRSVFNEEQPEWKKGNRIGLKLFNSGIRLQIHGRRRNLPEEFRLWS
ncbi:hypothetical protein M569_00661, partial [Genlisea aurea]